MAASGKRQGEGDRLAGRRPGEELRLQACRADGDASPGVSQMESRGLAACPGPPPHAGRVGWVLAAQLAHFSEKASLLQEETATSSQATSSHPGGPRHSVTLRHLKAGARPAESQNWLKDGEIKKKKEKSEVLGLFLFHLQLLSLQATLVLPLQGFSL